MAEWLPIDRPLWSLPQTFHEKYGFLPQLDYIGNGRYGGIKGGRIMSLLYKQPN
jgi:hypothetical protein